MNILCKVIKSFVFFLNPNIEHRISSKINSTKYEIIPLTAYQRNCNSWRISCLIFFYFLRLRLEKKPHRKNAVLRHETIVNRLHVVLHFIRPGEFLLADRTGEDLPLMPFVVEEGVTLEAVFILERFLYIDFCAFRTLIDALVYRRVPEQIQTPHGHFRQLFRRILTLGRCSASCPALDGLATGRCVHVTVCLRCTSGRRCRVVIVVVIVYVIV